MREHGIPLRSLETNKVLKDFDFVGFTLQYELSYSNILNMLDLGQVPVLAAERGEATRLLLLAGRAYITRSLWRMYLTWPLSAKAKKFGRTFKRLLRMEETRPLWRTQRLFRACRKD